MALLDIRNLNIEIQTPNGRMKIVDSVNLSLNEGEILGLVGESGSGKSLIAKVISNSIKDNWIVTADRFRFNDVELLKLTPNQRRKIVGKEISMIFQNPLSCLDPSRKIGKQLIQSIPNWTFKGRWWQWFGWKKRRAIELLHRVGIKNHQDIMASYPNELTEGEGQKVMIAVAVANQPRLLIADEPTNSLESITALQIFRLLSSMNQNQGTTILLASNDLKSISEWCDSISVLYCGQNTESGPTDQILEMPHIALISSIVYSSFTKFSFSNVSAEVVGAFANSNPNIVSDRIDSNFFESFFIFIPPNKLINGIYAKFYYKVTIVKKSIIFLKFLIK